MKVNLLTFYFIFFSLCSFSQNDEINYLISNKISSFNVIDSILNDDLKNLQKLELFVKKSKAASYIEGQLYGFNSLGKYYRNLSLFNKSINEYKKALALSIETKNSLSEIQNLNSIGSVYRRQDDIRNALYYHQEALNKALSIKNPSIEVRKSISNCQNSMGNIYISLKQYNLALKEFRKSIIPQETLNLKYGLAINHQNMGQAYENLNELDKALQSYHKSLYYNNLIKSDIGKIICGYSIANVLIQKKEYTKALVTVDTILQKAIKENDKYYLSKTYNTLALAQIYTGKLTEAKLNLNKALDLATNYNIQTVIVKANENFAFLYEKLKDYKKAYNYYKISKEEEAKIINEKNLFYVSQLITHYDKERSNNEIKYLANKNEIAELQITRNRNLWVIAICIFTLIIALLTFAIKQKGLKNEKDILSLKRDALRSQMNPHFIFNALNSIKLYIINNDAKLASRYLNKFSKLIRKILEGSNTRVICLEEELETMELYITIENIRFTNKIKYIVNVDEDINLQAVKIPPFALQPFLENALWHGLSTKKDNKKIMLSVVKNQKGLIEITIQDNGIGRKASAEIISKKSLSKKSMGINITKGRLYHFYRNYKKNYAIIYEDLFDKDLNSAGTKVVISIPLF
ncbi:tetratricopeptide repeat-containing sensor histidine kinase [Polaribacter sargassicola]|uniref:tetratricopeptide repeat-containing sensor histidine kinase n=1 Tax=Polaribacter sargassicola TaxID=2836891 RepID=UPI001F199293|nr:histidine kinase [Polaribacter sp. DS7-9]MCG1034962.1 tetratricopeptide repeat protein [Polaribacter sp. DS7-9]